MPADSNRLTRADAAKSTVVRHPAFVEDPQAQACYSRPVTPHKRWTQSDITDLRAQLQAGASAGDIAAATQRPLEGVRLMMSRLRLTAA